VSTTPVANGKYLHAEKFNYFVWTPLRCNQSDIVATTVFGTGVNDTGGKFTVVDTGGKLPPV
jgi:hypothetical protein